MRDRVPAYVQSRHEEIGERIFDLLVMAPFFAMMLTPCVAVSVSSHRETQTATREMDRQAAEVKV